MSLVFSEIFDFLFVSLVSLFEAFIGLDLILVKNWFSNVILNGLIKLHFITRFHFLVQVVNEILISAFCVLVRKTFLFSFVYRGGCGTLFYNSRFLELLCVLIIAKITISLKILQRGSCISSIKWWYFLFSGRWVP